MTDELATWVDELAPHALTPLHVLGAGMEGTVLALEGRLVAKVWHTKTECELVTVRSFYQALAETGLPLAAPRIYRIIRVGGRWTTIEPWLEGQAMASVEAGVVPSPLDPRRVEAVVDVLEALSEVSPRRELGTLPILPGDRPLGPRPFGVELAGLVERRVERFASVLAQALPDLDAYVTAVTTTLRELDSVAPTLIHGDLVAPNLLADDQGHPRAILDFGFFTCVGDPAFDAAVTSSIFDMYGPHARSNEAALEGAMLRRFGYDGHRLGLYRAAYALCTSNCFDPAGRDGHFAWCMALLRRPDVRASLS